MQEVKQTRILAENFIEYALNIGALEFVPEGRKLKSGRMSPYFFNSGLFNTGESIDAIATAYSDVIAEKFNGPDGSPTFDLLYGPPYKGTILVPVIASAQLVFGLGNIRFCTSRKETKDHGEGGSLIGSPIKHGDRVVIIDDVITDGGTKREAVEFIGHYGGIPTALVIALDRQERGTGELSAVQEFERDYGIPVHTVATLADIVSHLTKNCEAYDSSDINNCQEPPFRALESILAYQKQYGVS